MHVRTVWDGTALVSALAIPAISGHVLYITCRSDKDNYKAEMYGSEWRGRSF